MKRINLFQTVLAIICVTGLLSCKKDNPANECASTMAGISGTYMLESMQYKVNASATPVDYMAAMDACEKDDKVELKNNGTYVYTDAGSTCSPNGSNTGTWSVTGSEINSDGLIQGTIQSYDCERLVCYIENFFIAGDRITQTLRRL